MKLLLKLYLPLVVGILIIISALNLYWKDHQLEASRLEHIAQNKKLLSVSESEIKQHLLNRDFGSLFTTLETLEEKFRNQWLNLKVIRNDNKTIYPILKKEASEPEQENLIHISQPLIFEGSFLGHIELDLNWTLARKQILTDIKNIQNMVVAVAIFSIFFGFIGHMTAIYWPLKKLNLATEKISEGKFDISDLPTTSNDDIGRLSASFKGMIKELEFEKYALNQHAIVSATDASGDIIFVNDKFVQISGYNREELTGKNHRVIRSDRHDDSFYQDLWNTISSGYVWHGEVCNRKKNGDLYWVESTIVPFLDDTGKPLRYLSIRTDITAQKESENRLHDLAHRDPLTGLHNRYSLMERLEQSISQAYRSQNMIAVLYLDMDRFKQINDTLGHEAGDALLKQVAERLKLSARRKTDVTARIGGDEFVVVLNELEDTTAAALVATTVLYLLAQPYNYENRELHSTPSVGISIYPDDAVDSGELLKKADTAMYHAKRNGRNNYQFFTESMHASVQEKVFLENALRKALDLNQLSLHYQPKISAKTNQIIGFEALLRWNHPEHGAIRPDIFIPIAEKTGQIIKIGNWIADQACQQLKEWNSDDHDPVHISINVSVKQLKKEDFINVLEALISKYQVDPALLEIEITETVAMSDPEHTIKQLHAIRKLGLQLSIDDFGTGYSSLSYIKRLPINTLKLDKSFVSNLETDKEDLAICDATISLSHNLGLSVVAEGVENRKQKEILLSKNCDYFQGYLFSRPLPKDQATELLNSDRQSS